MKVRSLYPIFLSSFFVIAPSVHAVPLIQLDSNFSASVSWTVDPESKEDVLRGFIQYTPTSSTPYCSSIRFIQVARVEVSPGKDLQWGSGEANRNLMRTPDGYFVDHDAFKCKKGSPCSPYFRDSWANSNESQDGSNLWVSSPASLIDYPRGWSEFQRISLEACAQCETTGSFYGCVSWGGNWPGVGKRTLIGPTLSMGPSITFLNALIHFYRFYSSK